MSEATMGKKNPRPLWRLLRRGDWGYTMFFFQTLRMVRFESLYREVKLVMKEGVKTFYATHYTGNNSNQDGKSQAIGIHLFQ